MEIFARKIRIFRVRQFVIPPLVIDQIQGKPDKNVKEHLWITKMAMA
jgi:hypothetical protein